jgi:hypothetical protein
MQLGVLEVKGEHMIIYHINTYTYQGYAPGAEHWWSDITRYINQIWRSPLGTYKTHDEALSSALSWYDVNIKPGNLLLRGNGGVCDPQQCLRGPRDLKAKINALWHEAEKIGGWGTMMHDQTPAGKRQMRKICNQYDRLGVWQKDTE